MASLSLRHIYKKYPGNVVAVKDVNLEIKDKELDLPAVVSLLLCV